MNKEFKTHFKSLGWTERRNTFWVTDDERLMRSIYNRPPDEQKIAISASGREPIMSYKDGLRERPDRGRGSIRQVAFVAHDLFVKHLSFFVSDIIDVGIEILPMKDLEREMSSGVPYYERDLVNVLRQGRGVPAVPLILLGVVP